MAGDVLLTTTPFVAGAIFLVLALVLLAVRFNGRVNRAFATYLFLQGVAILLAATSRVNRGAAGQLQEMLVYVVLPLPLLLAYFVAVYRSPTGGLRVRATGVAVFLGVLFAEALYLLDHALAYDLSGPRPVAGPLAVLHWSLPLAQALTALTLARDARRGSDAKRPAALLVATGFAVLALIEGSLVAALFVTEGTRGFVAGFEPNLWVRLLRAMGLAALVVALVALAWVQRGLQAPRAAGGRGDLRPVALAVLAALTGLLLASQGLAQGQVVATAATFLVGAWRAFAATLIAYALVRHRFLDLDVRISWTVSRGAVVAVFVVTFVVVSQVAEGFLNQRFGWLWGGAATGLLVLALRPLERAGNRVADVLVPRGRPPSRFEQEERLRLYREQAFMVWADGVIGRKERLLLDNLRERLGIPVEAAASMEHEAAASHPGVASRPAAINAH